MITDLSHFTTRIARDAKDIQASQRLRYTVFVEEMGGRSQDSVTAERLERDRFDPFFDHLVLIDKRRDADALDHVVGVYRLMNQDQADQAGSFYSEAEYDLTKLTQSGQNLLELGRSCVHPDYRNGYPLFLLWQALSDHVAKRDIDILFGVASFPGTDPSAFAQALSCLHRDHLAPEHIRTTAKAAQRQRMDLVSGDQLDKVAGMRQTPSLIKSYLRLGGCVGEGAWIDHDFNTTDVCLILETANISEEQRARLDSGGEK